MKRGLLVAALVLVPFAALVVLGFLFSLGDAPVVLPDEPLVPEPPARATRLSGPPAAAASPTPPPAVTGAAAPALLTPFLPALGRCFSDNGLHGHVHLRFTPQRDGGFSGVAVDQNSTQSPYVAACVEDVLQSARFEPSPGPDYAPVDFTFSF